MIGELLLCLGAGLGPLVSYGQTGVQPLRPGDPAPSLAVGAWAKGTPVTRLGDGKVTIVEFWSMTCVPCIAEMPHLTGIAKKHGRSVQVVGIDGTDGDPTNLSYVRRVKPCRAGDQGRSANARRRFSPLVPFNRVRQANSTETQAISGATSQN